MRTAIICPAFVFLLSILSASAAWAQQVPEDPAEALALARKSKDEGLACLQKARTGDGDQRTLARKAMKLLEQSQACYDYYIEKKGEDEKIEEEMADVQSLIYWARKMTPLAEEEEEEKEKPRRKPPATRPKPEPRTPPKRPVRPRPAQPVSREAQARALFDKARAFERQHPDAFFAISARYFEIVSKYQDTAIAGKAYDKCVEYQHKLMAREKGVASGTSGSAAKGTYKPSGDVTLIRIGLRHQQAMVRKANIRSLFTQLGRKALYDFHRMYTEEKDPGVLTDIANCLVKLGDLMTVRYAKRKAQVEDEALATKVIALAGKMGKPDYVKPMMMALATNTKRLVPDKEMIYVVRGEQGYVPPYASLVRSAYTYGIRKFAIDTLKRMGKTGVTGLVRCMKGGSAVTREAVLCAGILEDHKMCKYLAPFLHWKNAYAYRTEAMASIYIIGVKSVPYLVKNLKVSSTRKWAAFLLREITNEDWGMNDAKKFMNWYRVNKGR